jgi:Ca2+-binding EF-hand superfamily protein
VQEQQAHFRELRDLIKKYDEDRSGNLNAQELGKCIKAYSDARQWTREPVFPTEEEANLILHAAGKHKTNAIDASEIEFALDLWHSYVTNKSKIEEIFVKYDTNHSEKLEFDQLARYLTDLNEGHSPKVTLSHGHSGFAVPS